MKLKNFAFDQWIEGIGAGQLLHDATNGSEIAVATSKGIDLNEMLHHARTIGNRNLRKMTFHERGNMLKALALHLNSKKELFYEISYATGATRADSAIDIEGGINALFSYAALSKRVPDNPYYCDGNVVMARKNSFPDYHFLIPKEGVALHINPFCLPVWNMLGKVAANWLAGVPAVIKPATLTSFLSEAVAKEIVTSGVLPKGAFQMICGSADGILDYIEDEDVITFTGSADTGLRLRSHPNIINRSIPFIRGADSLNACILGPDVKVGTMEFDIFIRKVVREITSNSGQRCTAIRRIIVPEKHLEAVHANLVKALEKIAVGDPRMNGVELGPLVSQSHVEEVSERVHHLSSQTPVIYQREIKTDGKGAFFAPILMLNDSPLQITDTHETEIFGPVCTLMPYHSTDEAIAIVRSGKGSACSTVVTNDDKFARQFILSAASTHERLLVVNKDTVDKNNADNILFPLFFYGEYMSEGGGDIHSLSSFMKRTTVQAPPGTVTSLTNVYQQGSQQKETDIHLFRKHFEELEIGDTLITRKRTITAADISNFANLSWDHFYAHTDVTALEGSMFSSIAAHGYLILSAAAGLFVEGSKGPVLLNYGLEDCRFTKPVYAGTTIGVKLTVKEKIEQERRNNKDMAKGIVKFLVNIYDEAGDTVAIATILTMVKKLMQENVPLPSL